MNLCFLAFTQASLVSTPSQSLDGDGVVFDDTEPDTKHSPRLTIITKYKATSRPSPASHATNTAWVTPDSRLLCFLPHL